MEEAGQENQQQESQLTSLDLDIEAECGEEDGENNEVAGMKRVAVKLSAILPKPGTAKPKSATPGRRG